jgi:hypothetical protein
MAGRLANQPEAPTIPSRKDASNANRDARGVDLHSPNACLQASSGTRADFGLTTGLRVKLPPNQPRSR